MKPKKISGCTRILGLEQKQYLPLAVRDIMIDECPAMMTAWEVTPEELEEIKNGEPVIIIILGDMHPPIMIGVGEPPPADLN